MTQIISSERLIVEFSHTSENCYKLVIYPNAANFHSLFGEENDLINLNMDVYNVQSDVDIIDKAIEVMDIDLSKPELDPYAAKYLGFNKPNFQIQSILPYDMELVVPAESKLCELHIDSTQLYDVGKFEKKLLNYDLKNIGRISSITLIIAEALALVRKSARWVDMWYQSEPVSSEA